MDTREARKERRREQVRDEILEAAGRVLLSGGLSNLTLAAVARELHLTKAALYHYFASKEALLFELVYGHLERHAAFVGGAVDQAASGPDAVEALIRASSEHYATRKDQLRMSYLVPQVGSASSTRFGPEMLERIRPFNDQMYGAVGAKIRADQRAGLVDPRIDGRRVAFVAHTSVIGMLTVEGLVEVADDAPLIHARDAMVEDLVAAFRARLHPPA